ncbi:unnamed protein product [Schistocephalus solidus]|uniref:IRS-type PTB domain-containing protein n=1 Tax=Schistocephalus solidus TaxID=70667 RepID=A0A183T564_SCHSO|nr:unnamed protein product [Schistocephalus solidus]
MEGNPLGTAQPRRTPVNKVREVSRPVTPKKEPVKTKGKPCSVGNKGRTPGANGAFNAAILYPVNFFCLKFPEVQICLNENVTIGLKHVQFTNVDGKLVDITVPTGSDRDETYELLRANEKLARLVAEAKMHSEEANALNPSSQPLIARASTIEEVSTKFSLPVTKLEITAKVTPPTLATQSSEELNVLVKETPAVMSKARECKIDSAAGNSSVVSARGDLPEIVKNVMNGSAYSSNDVPFATPSRPPALISNLIREMCYKELMEKQTLDPVTSPVPNARPVAPLPADRSTVACISDVGRQEGTGKLRIRTNQDSTEIIALQPTHATGFHLVLEQPIEDWKRCESHVSNGPSSGARTALPTNAPGHRMLPTEVHFRSFAVDGK